MRVNVRRSETFDIVSPTLELNLQKEQDMLRTSKITLVSLVAAGAVALSLAAMTPADARGGGGRTKLTTKFLMENGAQFNMNTRAEALARQQQGQLASAGDEDKQAENRGWVIDLISICDHLKDTEITCE